MHSITDEKGFTLVELIVVINISMIVIALMIMFYLFVFKFSVTYTKRYENRQMIERTVTKINRNLRRGENFVLYRYRGRTYLTDYRGDTLHFRPDAVRYSDFDKLSGLENMYFTARFDDNSTLEVDSSDVVSRPFQFNLEKGVDSRYIKSMGASFTKNGEKYYWNYKNENFVSNRRFVNVE